MTEWTGDTLWWQDGVQLLQAEHVEQPTNPEVINCSAATEQAPAADVPTAGAAAAAGAKHTAPVMEQAAVDSSTPDSSKDLDLKAAKASKSYLRNPPAKQQPYFEFLVRWQKEQQQQATQSQQRCSDP
jgi:hypothetical protein